MSQFLSPITIIEGISLDFNKHFHLIFGKYVHTYEGTKNNMKEWTVGAIALGPSRNLQGGVRCYSLLTGKVLHQTMNDVIQLKMPQEAMRRLQYRCKKQRSVEGLKFSNRHRVVDRDSSMPATETEVTIETKGQVVNVEIQVEESVKESEEPPINETLGAERADDIDLTGVAGGTAAEEVNAASGKPDHSDIINPSTADNKVQPPEDSDTEEEEEEEGVVTTRSGRVSRAYNFASNFPDLYRDQHYMSSSSKGRFMRPYYYDKDQILRLSNGIFISDAYYTTNISMEERESGYGDSISSLDEHKYQLYAEALDWVDYNSKEIHALVYKASTMSVKEGIRKHGKEAKALALKEARNLVGNECFGEINQSTLTQAMKDKALPILMFMIMKRNGLLRTRGVADGSVERIFTSKEDVSLPTPDFYAFKYICALIAKESRDVATLNFPGFFLQTEQEGEEMILLKLTGEVVLLLIECEPSKWTKHLQYKNGKPVIYVECKKAIYGTMNAALLAYKKLAKL